MKHIKKIIIVFIAIVAIFMTYNYIKKRNEVQTDLKLFGNIEIRQVDMGFRIEGDIDKMFYEEGDIVKKGDLLASLKNTQYKSEYQKAIAEIELSKAAHSDAKSKYERNIPLCKENTTSQQDCVELKNKKDETAAAIKLASATAQYANNNVKDSYIYAPCDGIVMTRVQEPGSVATPGQPIYTIAKNKPVWIRAYVPETNLGNIKYGMKATISTDSIDPKTNKQRKYTGWIGFISPVAEFTPKTVETTELRTDLVYRIRVYVYETDEFLRQGMPVSININLLDKSIRPNLKGDYE